MTEIRTILLAEDSPHDAEMAIDALREAHLVNPIVHVEDGVEALDYLLRRGRFADRTDPDPAVLLLDIKMPRMDGLEVLKRLREAELLATLDLVYRRTSEIASIAGELEGELQDSDFDLSKLGADNVSDAPVVRLLQTLFEDAVQMKASDIHIEPDEGVVRIRQRIDGVLNEQVMKEQRIASALVMRLKIMSGLDISEKRLPQDGRFNIRVKNRSIDVRVSTMPVQYGESVVMRLLDQSAGIANLDAGGMPPDMLARFRRLLQRPYGMVLVTGPTGSGKTTTLYAGLAELNSPEKKIITVEDPVEYRLPRINQVQVNTKIELTFARVLRAALRQDPDIVLVGEIRDQETAEIGLRAAITGHLLLSTLHTKDTVSTPFRLLDMGAPPFMVATSLQAVLARQGLTLAVALATVLLADPAPQLVVLDEPTSGLDRETELAFLNDIPVALAGRTVLLATHAAIPDGPMRVRELKAGRLEDAR